MFNDRYGLTKAVIEGTKTQTRRVVKNSKNIEVKSFDRSQFPFGDPMAYYRNGEGRLVDTVTGTAVGPKYTFGQRIAVAQPYKDVAHHVMSVSGQLDEESPGWNNKMFVSADLMPVRISITGVKAERIQDISDEDCMKEGIVQHCDGYGFVDTKSKDGMRGPYGTPKEAFEQLIRKVSGNKAWDDNPFVFAYSFKVE